MTGNYSVNNKMRQFKISPYAPALQYMSDEFRECIPPLLLDSSGLRDAHVNTLKVNTEKNCNEFGQLLELDMMVLRDQLPEGPSGYGQPKKYVKKTYR